jgi:flagellar basal-body rod protein FlgB
MSGFVDPTMSILTQALDGLTTRQSLISSNLANIDTPNYQPQGVDFETTLQNEIASANPSAGSALPPSSGPAADVAMETTDPRHMSAVGIASGTGSGSVSSFSENIRNDGNQVDLESEMTALTETQLKYEADSRFITGKFSQLYDVLGGH